MYRRIILKFIFFLLPCTIFAQSVSEIKQNKALYIWGEGSGNTLKEADNEALADLISQISTQVESNFQKNIEQTSSENSINFKETVNDLVKTYSSATLSNTERLVLQNEPDAKVFRYIKRSEINKIFESRKDKIIELSKDGENALRNLQIGDALRYFYWSQTLLRSHPDANEIKMSDSEGKDRLLITWIPLEINEIMENLSVKVKSVEPKENYSTYLLDIRYKNQPVLNLDYTYWTGQDWSNVISAKNGIGIVELPKTAPNGEIRIKAEYVFEGEANIDMELRDVMQKLPQVPYKSAYMNVNTKPEENKQSAVASSGSSYTNSTYSSMKALTNTSIFDNIMAKIREAISAGKYSSVENLFTPEGYSIYNKLLQYGNAHILLNRPLKYYKYNDWVACRSIPMSFNFKTNNRTFVEDVVFYLDKDNKVCNITFSLDKKAVNDIASNNTWNESDRQLIISFLENYKTAYALKRLDYISSIFSDDALIITGRVIKINRGIEYNNKNCQIIQYNRQNKTDYLKKLQYSFAGNEYINIRFADNNVRRSGKGGEVYGIQIKQDYFSSNYGDSGYLFLLIDLSDKNNPQIDVRTWQPEKNANGKIYGIEDF